jgi:hypothetical protein
MLGIDQDRNAALFGSLNDTLADILRQAALGIIREHDGIRIRHGRFDLRDHRVVRFPRISGGLFCIETQHLLPAAQDAELGRSGMARNLSQLRIHAGIPQKIL